MYLLKFTPKCLTMPTCWGVVEISMPFRDGFSFSNQRCARNQLLPGNLQWESAAKERKWKEASEIHWWDAIARSERNAQAMPVQNQEHFHVWSIVHLTQNDILANKLAFSSSWWFRVFLGPSGPRLDEGWWKQTKRRRQTREIDAGEICLSASEKSGLRFKGLGAVMSHRTKQYNMTTSGPIQPFGRLRGDLPSLVLREVSPVACSFSQKPQSREEADVLKASTESLQMQRKSGSVYLAMYCKFCNLLAGHRQNWVPLLDPDECTIQMLRWVPKFMIWPTWDKSHTITIIHDLDCKLI